MIKKSCEDLSVKTLNPTQTSQSQGWLTPSQVSGWGFSLTLGVGMDEEENLVAYWNDLMRKSRIYRFVAEDKNLMPETREDLLQEVEKLCKEIDDIAEKVKGVLTNVL